jgi:integrase
MGRLETLYEQISPSRPAAPAPIRALPAVVVEDLYRLFNSDSPDNPFRTPALRWRNFLIFLMLLHLGLRRSEAAILPAEAIKEDFDPATGDVRMWLNVDETDEDGDPRYEAPSLKTAHSRRQLPVSAEVVKVADTLLGNYRRGMSHGFLFAVVSGIWWKFSTGDLRAW